MGEALHTIQGLKGKVVSITTDGFITDIPDLESKITGVLTNKYRELRLDLSGDPNAYELKTEGRGIIS